MKKLLLVLLFVPLTYCSSDSGSEATTPPPIVTTPPPVVNYTLTVSSGDGGAVSSIGGTYTSGESVSITATANSEYVFSGWSNGSTDNPLSVTMSSDQTITASFEKVTYTLSTSTEGEGTVTEVLVSSGRTADYNSGSVVQLTAVPSDGWSFNGWTGDYVGVENPIDIDVTQAKSYNAVFEKVTYTLSLTTQGEGTITETLVSSGRYTDYNSGSVVQLTAVPSSEWNFIGWTGDYVGVENPIEISVTESKTITANFEENDSDNDGIIDANDNCNDTSEGASVDSNGCERLTYIPDDNFEQFFIDQGLDDVLDDYIKTIVAESISGLEVFQRQISDLTGIEDFTNLEILKFFTNNITQIDLSKNLKLTILYGYNNQLTSLDLSKNVSLTELNINNNQLTSLDLTNNVNLTRLNCDSNQLTSLIVGSKLMTELYCRYNEITSLDVSDNTLLVSLDCTDNQLVSLDISNNISLDYLALDNSQLTSIDLSNNPLLRLLRVSENQLTSLDVSQNNSLSALNVENNRLTSLDVSNNTSLTNLITGFNFLTTLDVSNNTSLTYVSFNNNQISNIDISNNTSLTNLNGRYNQLTSINVSENILLDYLHLGNNQLTTLDVKNNTVLRYIDCYSNPLTCVTVSQSQLERVPNSSWRFNGAWSLDCN